MPHLRVYFPNTGHGCRGTQGPYYGKKPPAPPTSSGTPVTVRRADPGVKPYATGSIRDLTLSHQRGLLRPGRFRAGVEWGAYPAVMALNLELA